ICVEEPDELSKTLPGVVDNSDRHGFHDLLQYKKRKDKSRQNLYQRKHEMALDRHGHQLLGIKHDLVKNGLGQYSVSLLYTIIWIRHICVRLFYQVSAIDHRWHLRMGNRRRVGIPGL